MKPICLSPLPVALAAILAWAATLGAETPAPPAPPIPDEPESEEGLPPFPEELLDDEHVREEFGVNQFTAPSIRRIFADLQRLRPLPYEELKREIPERTPQDRTQLALVVGFLLADGFFAVEAEQFFDLEPIGRSLLNHAKVLGSGTRISGHMKSMLEKGALSDWDELKIELARTQQDVEREMVMIRDVDAANLISLGGWLRAFEIGCASSLNPYDPEKAAVLARPDVVEYFVLNLETLEPRIQNNEVVSVIHEKLIDVQARLEAAGEKALEEEELEDLYAVVESLVDRAYGTERVLASGAAPDGDTPSAEVPATGGVISGEVPN